MDIKNLINKAIEAKEKAYAPYSKFKVGSAVLTKDGKIYTGCNIESASYTPTICAERTAISKAVSEGDREFEAIAIVGSSDYTFPCGVCRQVIREFSKDIKVIVANNTDEYKIFELEELLPNSFGPDDLK
ncbi:cytidine deaminase Cdd [Gottschalkia acidurici 9a]|uniref:Cytidine deaminase n=1 Tax=Gottschalkia acidurici (strain ATCC 7906 / DSM 604 / BCRC 14475 / CIP 104303 / KCTC 5404 / NCIMB 10678 / 9a) TaxID=1128398 RepID=K0AYG3_GOTA9|nr:cytidine deaminase [Gottschalkia acidurici]AFS78818.1 cytidine deaminase Cdd [Gottschalkia acidurici 9a]